jgi:uncharacterized protein YndB with AHSA1/START domain
MTILTLLASLASLASLAFPPDPPAGKVRTDRTIALEVTLDKPPADVYALWTTAAGVRKFLAPDARIEPTLGGRYQIVFDPAGDAAGAHRGTKGARILRLVPNQAIAFEWPMPAFGPELGGPPIHTWVELRLEPAAGRPGRTRLRIAMQGWKRGGKWGDAFTLFGERHWPLVLNRLVVYCRDGVSPAWDATGDTPGDPIDRILVKAATLRAPLAEVWKAWTTTEGVKTFFAPEALVEAVPGGRFEMYFSKDAPAGSRGSEGCRVLAVEPMRSFAFDWNAPPHLPAVRAQRTNVQLLFEPLGPGATRVRLLSLGWGTGEEWRKAHEYFDKAWSYVLAQLERRFDSVGLSR